MHTLTWDNIDFEQVSEPGVGDLLSNIYEDNGYIRRAQISIATLLLILAGLLIVAVAGVKLYTVYTQDKQIESAIQMAKDQNRQIEIYTSNGFEMNLNVTSTTKFSVAGKSSNVTQITVYPRNYRTEYIIPPNGQIITPYSITVGY